MRLFLIGWADDIEELVDVIKKIKERGHEILYWTRCSDNVSINKSDFVGTIFHDYHDALAVRSPQELCEHRFPPVSQDIIKRLYDVESTVLIMMIKKFDFLSIMERKNFYYELLRYWFGVINKLKPEVILFPAPPHTVYDFVIYSIAKLLGLKTILFEFTRINDRLLLSNDFTVGNVKLENKILQDTIDHSVESLEEDIRRYYLAHTQVGTNLAPPDVKPTIDKYRGINLLVLKVKMIWRSIWDLSIFKKALLFLYKKFNSNLRTEYQRLQSNVSLEKKFVFVPLNYQPESTTSPLGGVFVDQIQMIEILSFCLPPDWSIYVKEHPLQWGPRGYNFFGYRYENYYKKINSIKNVFLVPVETDPYQLINKSQIVATVTGTAGWEAILRQKPVFYFGFPWFRNCPGAFRVTDVDSCKKAFSEICNGFTVDTQKIINYLYVFGKSSLRGYLDLYCQTISDLTPEQNRDNVFNAIIKDIENK